MKAKINIDAFLEYVTSDKFSKEDFYKEYKDYFYGKWNEDSVKKLSNAIEYNFYNNRGFYNHNLMLDIYKKAKTVNDYVTLHNFLWIVDMHIDKYVVVSYGKVSIFILEDYVEFIDEPDYSNYSISEVKQKLLHTDTNDTLVNFPAQINDLSIKDTYTKQKNVTSEIDKLKTQMEDVKQNKNEELAKIQAEIDEKMAILNAKKEAMLSELSKQMSEFNEKLEKLKNQIFMLKTSIYSIRCFAGETVELIQLREGKQENIESPIVLNQKMLYLDEDLAKTMSIYSDDISGNYHLLEEVLKYSDSVMEMFCPQTKCISFFKCSKHNKTYDYNSEDDILESYDMLHGNKIGFVVRNGENLYVGWLEEEWDKDTSDRDEHKLSFIEDVFYKAEVRALRDDEDSKSTSIEEMVSRYFALSVVQGLIEHGKIISIPEVADIRYQSKYIVHNYADAWIDDNRYGSFDNFMNNINQYIHVGDTILVIQNVSESNYRPYEGNRSKGERNTTRDCRVESGLYDVNLIDDDRIFISVKRSGYWNNYKNNANFEITKYEFINLQNMNSIWLKYFIDTKKIGSFGRSVSNRTGFSSSLEYSYLIKYFKIAYKYLVDREAEEEQMINRYVDDISKYNWKELLSHWKIIYKVRNFTENRAKSFAKYLMSNNYVKLSNLFKDNFMDVKLEIPSIQFYHETRIEDEDRNVSLQLSFNSVLTHPEFASDNIHNTEQDVTYNNESSTDEIKEKENLDITKLTCIMNEIKSFAIKYDVWDNGCINIKDLQFKSHKAKTWSETFSNTIAFIISNLETCHLEYDKIKEVFLNEMKNSKYWMYKRMSQYESLLKLRYLYYIQHYIYPEVMNYLRNKIKYNYIYKLEKW